MDTRINQIRNYRDKAKERLLQNDEKEAISYASGALFKAFDLASDYVFRHNIMFPNRETLLSIIHKHERGQAPEQANSASKELVNLQEALLCNLLEVDFVNYLKFKDLVTTKPSFGGESNLLSTARYNLGSVSVREVVDYCTFTTDLILNKLTEFDRPFSFINSQV